MDIGKSVKNLMIDVLYRSIKFLIGNLVSRSLSGKIWFLTNNPIINQVVLNTRFLVWNQIRNDNKWN